MRPTDCYHGPTANRYDEERMRTWLDWIARGCPPRSYWRPVGWEGNRWD